MNPKDNESATDCFMSDLSFGTAGLRSEIDIGFNRMNVVTVGIASMGIAAYLKDKFGRANVIIGHDHRHGSEEFSKIAAKIYKSYGHGVKLFPGLVPTPFVPAAIQCEGGMDLGVMVTASHNPKNDNGYKVYGGNGAQILDATAKEISEHIKKERDNYLMVSKGCESIEVEEDFELLERVRDWYNSKIKSFVMPIEPKIKVVYTALHGVGADYVDQVFKSVYGGSDKIVHVQEQRRPDPDFPTVEFPNPEEGRSTLKLATETAEREGIDVVFANDPDADRFCVAERRREGEGSQGEWRVFNGNEIAVLLADYLSKKVSRDDESQCAMLSSCVSSRFLERFCSRRGWRHETTSTGFKNLGNRGLQLKKEGVRVLLAYEEAIGFQVGDWNFDKDGISALIVFYALLNENEVFGSLSARLERIYEREGCRPIQFNGYYYGNRAGKIKEILSNAKEPNQSNVKSFERSASSYQVKVEFELGSVGPAWLILRPSGTEPKLKYYSEVISEKGDNVVGAGAGKALELEVEKLIEGMIEPCKNNLTKR